jgi:[protein-PII] uridylyltransferase
MLEISNLVSHWESLSGTQEFCLCLTGSAARGEAAPYSDIDVLIIAGNSSVIENESSVLLQGLHEIVQRVSVVVRTVEDCESMRTEDIRSWLALLDSEFIAGNRALFTRLWRMIGNECIRVYEDIYLQLAELTSDRHEQYGSSTALLEPNVKNSAGSLRDIQILCYLEIISALKAGIDVSERKKDWNSIIEHSTLLPERRRALIEARRFLLDVRRRMHVLKGHLHDTLEFELQTLVSNGVECNSDHVKKSVEQFMRLYYQHSRTVHLSLELSMFDHAPKMVMGSSTSDADVIHLPLSGLHCAEDVIAIFIDAAYTQRTIGSDVIRAMTHAIDFEFSSTACCRMFDQLLRSPSHVGKTLRSMHECGVLKKVFPEFSSVEHFFQHNIYHYYTLDEHILKMMETADMLSKDSSEAGNVFRRVTDTSLLYYAILLHDIAKPIDIARHEIEGARMVPDIMRRYGRHNAVSTVSFLVEHHLQMEQMAFRRDIRDITTVRAFAEITDTVKQLDLLFVLTYADMSALNPRVLTEWKKVLLFDLYNATRRYLGGEGESIILSEPTREYNRPDGISEEEYSKAIEDVREGEPVRVFFIQHRAFTEIIVVCMDRSQLLSQLAAALLAADVNVVDASIDTQLDVAIDMFRVTDVVRNRNVDDQGMRTLRTMITNVCKAEVYAEEIFIKFRRKWVRKIRKTVQTSVRTEVLFINADEETNHGSSIIEVYAPDAYGLLYILCREISAFGLNIVFAKIATRVDGVVDSFYVREASGAPFTDVSRKDSLRQTLLRHISAVSHPE